MIDEKSQENSESGSKTKSKTFGFPGEEFK